MDNYQKFGQVSGQIFIGIGFGLAGALVSLIIADLFYNNLDLFGIGMYSYLGFYIWTQVGIGFDGFRFLKKLGRQTDFLKFFLQSIFGMMLGLGIFYYLIFLSGLSVSPGLVNLFSFILPLSGSIIGFNFRLSYTKKDNG